MRLPLSIALLAAVFASTATAQTYRADDTAPVLTPPSAAPAAPERDTGFMQAYRSAGSPKTIFFWNRNLAEDVRDPTQTVELYNYYSRLGLVTARVTTRQDAGKVANPPPPQVDLRIKSGFQSVIRANQLRMVDRNMAIRMANKSKAQVEDRQTNETRALDGMARLLIEAIVVEDARSPAGAGLQMKALDIQSGVILAELYYTGEEPARGVPAPPQYVALAEGGYAPVETEAPLVEFGQRAAEALIAEMTPAVAQMRAPARKK